MYKCKHFIIEELVTVRMFEDSCPPLLWHRFDARALMTLDALRDKFGICIVNDWMWGGGTQFAGLRPFQCDVGAQKSFHKVGMAFDPKFDKYPSEEVREYIRKFPDQFRYINAMEKDVYQFHFDTRNCDRIFEFGAG